MGMPGFFDLDERFAKLDGSGDPLARLASIVDWEGFRPVLDAALSKPRRAMPVAKKLQHQPFGTR